MRSALIATMLDSVGEFDTESNCDDQCQGEIAERNHRNSVVRHPYNDPKRLFI